MIYNTNMSSYIGSYRQRRRTQASTLSFSQPSVSKEVLSLRVELIEQFLPLITSVLENEDKDRVRNVGFLFRFDMNDRSRRLLHCILVLVDITTRVLSAFG
jgi:hypothetical protein